MTMRLNRHGYEELVAGDLAWLEQQPRTLERDHVIAIVKASVEHEYPSDPKLAEQIAAKRSPWPPA